MTVGVRGWCTQSVDAVVGVEVKEEGFEFGDLTVLRPVNVC